MRDPEFIELRNKFLLGLFITIIFCVPIIFIFINKFGNNDPNIIKELKNNKTLILYVTNNKCDRCYDVEKILKDNRVIYYKSNIDKDVNYIKIIKELNMKEEDINPPTLILVKKGKLYSSLVDITDENELLEYIKNNNLN